MGTLGQKWDVECLPNPVVLRRARTRVLLAPWVEPGSNPVSQPGWASPPPTPPHPAIPPQGLLLPLSWPCSGGAALQGNERAGAGMPPPGGMESRQPLLAVTATAPQPAAFVLKGWAALGTVLAALGCFGRLSADVFAKSWGNRL